MLSYMPTISCHSKKSLSKGKLNPIVSLISMSLVCASLPVFAQTAKAVPASNNSEPSNKQETITVVATGNARDTFNLPMQVAVIENTGPKIHAFTATDLLRQQAGLQITGTGRANGQNITLRGYDKRGILIQVDGIKQGTDTGHIDGTFIDSSLIKRVEIVKGPNALLYGSGALGGVIAYQTVDANDLLLDGQQFGMTHFIQGATGDNSIGTGVTAYGKTDNFDGLISGVFRQRGDLKQAILTSPNDEQIGNVLAKANWYLAQGQKLFAQLRFYDNDAQQPKNPQQNEASNGPTPTLSDLNNSLVQRKTKQTDINLGYTLKPINQNLIDLSLTGYHQKITIDQTAFINPVFESREQTKNGLKLENKSIWQSSFLASHHFTYGSEVYREEQTPNAPIQNVFPEAKIDFTSAWLQDEMTLIDLPASLIIGTRFDDYHAKNPKYDDVKANNWSSRAGISINPLDWFMVYASYSEAFRAPGLAELYNDSRHFAIGPFYTNNWVPNPNLKPERNETLEYGIGFQFEDLVLQDDVFQLKATYFDTKAKDYISTTVDMNFSAPPPGFPVGMPYGKGTTMASNIDRASIHGYEAELTYQTPYVNTILSYSRVRGKDDRTNQWIEALSPDALGTQIDIPIFDSGLTLSWLGRFVDRSTRVNGSTDHQSGYGINNFYLSYENTDWLPNAQMSVGLENAFDKEYFSPQGIPQPTQNAVFKASYRF
ncbi:TonB-dependent hemoglobin/transferrin/lactoferrin family receptor [Thorsellia anophelis]|uniref:Hemoglobin/transferrin/lactoferrin receptor protein n=1 Tax=Thorsellia anophelis DSM 18579 TaxID=1123402 RepID=A0A1I0EE92_9GAMM|nr:TonB-dependent hemoglobin/transferrin/lactoferrin family receptor [Thorsellia anophelis]SET43366.1 hemoglobin/transferrin/lactoferrin receptor protein [Thorsellia anophelis DSM 18579]